MRIMTLLIVLGSLPAIAAETGPEVTEAPAPPTAPAAVSAAPAAASESPVPAASAVPAPAAAAAVAPAAAAPAVEEFKPPSGYKKKTREGRQVYCRSETPIGTRFPTEYCFTQADLERIERNKRSMQLDHAARTKMCTTGSACSGGG